MMRAKKTGRITVDEAKNLVVTLRQADAVVIGDPANPIGLVRVAQTLGDRVRVAFEFPEGIQVNREELALRKLAGPWAV